MRSKTELPDAKSVALELMNNFPRKMAKPEFRLLRVRWTPEWVANRTDITG
ncbi:MAG: hypothetical protein LUG99_20470 [Lachnospiraceae bacterium]|nr:hypothetical protein [Lachnospiraceae bacterium]